MQFKCLMLYIYENTMEEIEGTSFASELLFSESKAACDEFQEVMDG